MRYRVKSSRNLGEFLRSFNFPSDLRKVSHIQLVQNIIDQHFFSSQDRLFLFLRYGLDDTQPLSISEVAQRLELSLYTTQLVETRVNGLLCQFVSRLRAQRTHLESELYV